MNSDFDLKNEDIPTIEPDGLFSWWIKSVIGIAFIILFIAFLILKS